MKPRVCDLPEGFRHSLVPAGLSYGRVLSIAELDERHVSVRVLGRVWCLISGKYAYPSGNVYWRLQTGRVH